MARLHTNSHAQSYAHTYTHTRTRTHKQKLILYYYPQRYFFLGCHYLVKCVHTDGDRAPLSFLLLKDKFQFQGGEKSSKKHFQFLTVVLRTAGTQLKSVCYPDVGGSF